MRGGPGEKQLELDRRMLKLRIKQLKEKLDKLKRQRTMQRKKKKPVECAQHFHCRLYQCG